MRLSIAYLNSDRMALLVLIGLTNRLKKGENMEGIVLALVALRNEFRPLQKPLAEPEFRRFDLSALNRRYSVEEVGRDLLMLKAKRGVCI